MVLTRSGAGVELLSRRRGFRIGDRIRKTRLTTLNTLPIGTIGTVREMTMRYLFYEVDNVTWVDHYDAFTKID